MGNAWTDGGRRIKTSNFHRNLIASAKCPTDKLVNNHRYSQKYDTTYHNITTYQVFGQGVGGGGHGKTTTTEYKMGRRGDDNEIKYSGSSLSMMMMYDNDVIYSVIHPFLPVPPVQQQQYIRGWSSKKHTWPWWYGDGYDSNDNSYNIGFPSDSSSSSFSSYDRYQQSVSLSLSYWMYISRVGVCGVIWSILSSIGPRPKNYYKSSSSLLSYFNYDDNPYLDDSPLSWDGWYGDGRQWRPSPF